jgi:hypothetical protein
VSSSSASPDTFSSPSELSTKPSKARNGHPDQTYPTGSHNNNKASSNEEPPRDGASAASVKGKEKDDPEIDWTGWEPHGYKIPELEKLRALLVNTFNTHRFLMRVYFSFLIKWAMNDG